MLEGRSVWVSNREISGKTEEKGVGHTRIALCDTACNMAERGTR